MGSAPNQPDNPDKKTTNKYHFAQLQQQFGIDDSPLKSALEGGTITVFKVPDFSYKWGYLVIGPCTATIKARNDGNYEVTFQLVEKKSMSPKSFILPYKKGERPLVYNGEIKNETQIMTAEELQDIMVLPFAQGGAPAAGGMSPMGGL